MSGTDIEPEKLVYVSFGEKNNLGGLKHRNVRQKRIEHYANDEEPAMCLVRLYKKYLEKCPKTAVQGNNVLYLTPRQKYKSTDEGMMPGIYIDIALAFIINNLFNSSAPLFPVTLSTIIKPSPDFQ